MMWFISTWVPKTMWPPVSISQSFGHSARAESPQLMRKKTHEVGLRASKVIVTAVVGSHLNLSEPKSQRDLLTILVAIDIDRSPLGKSKIIGLKCRGKLLAKW